MGPAYCYSRKFWRWRSRTRNNWMIVPLLSEVPHDHQFSSMLCVIHRYVPTVRFRRRDTFSVFRIISTGSGRILIGGYLSYTVKYGTPYSANVKTTDL